MQTVNGRVNVCRNARTDMRATVTFGTAVLGDVDFVPRNAPGYERGDNLASPEASAKSRYAERQRIGAE